jgi:hypothetical protein
MNKKRVWITILFVTILSSFVVLFDFFPFAAESAFRDLNGNGVRDDVEERILAKYGSSSNLKNAMFQLAIALQKSVVDERFELPRALEISIEVLRAHECVTIVDAAETSDSLDIEAWVVNDEARIRRYNRYNGLLSGQILNLGEDEKFCQFEIEQ